MGGRHDQRLFECVGDADRLSEMALRRSKVADLTEHRPERDPRAHLAGPVTVSFQGTTGGFQRCRGAAEVAPPVQHRPAVDHRPRPLGAVQHGRGVVEQVQRAVEVAEAADDDGERHLQPSSELGGARRVGERRRLNEARRRPRRGGRARARRCRSPTAAGRDRHDPEGRAAVAESPRRALPTGSASTWSRSSVTLIVSSASTVRDAILRSGVRSTVEIPSKPTASWSQWTDAQRRAACILHPDW